ncbi:exopolysaccharide biosynthesis protein [Yoonia sp. 2307UL14-13]|uniref:exopolysaccharide biosynthesis protein n=1 Tax=Yoonia sp. 2307UL14-13 TaxID=3126506 RepID=UPI00309E9294
MMYTSISMDEGKEMAQAAPVTQIIDTLDATVTKGRTRTSDILAAFGSAGIAPVLAVPALLVMSPLSGIPLFSTFCGFLILVIAVQGVMGRSELWLPGFVGNRVLPAKRTQDATHALRRIAYWLDRATRQRLTFLVKRPANRVLYLICAFFAAAIPILELVPLSSSIVGAGVALIAIGILARDGLFAIVGLATFPLVPVIPIFVVSRVAEAV